MKSFLFLILSIILLGSCSNKNADTGQLFCDTACNNDSFVFRGSHPLHPYVAISVSNCMPDTLTWGHDALDADRKMHMGTLLDKIVRLNPSAIDCYINDTTMAWLTFNDCKSGRGYLLKLPFNKSEDISKISSALTHFDKKFSVPEDLRAYADYSTLYVVDVKTGKTEQMSFKEELKFSFDQVHEAIDSIHVSRNRIYVMLNKNGQQVPLEKNINL